MPLFAKSSGFKRSCKEIIIILNISIPNNITLYIQNFHLVSLFQSNWQRLVCFLFSFVQINKVDALV